MDLFNLWALFRRDDGSFQFDVTPANMPLVKDGSAEWIASSLKSFGVELPVLRWRITPFRSSYHSSYPDDPNWKDRWTRGWTIEIDVDGDSSSHVNQLRDAPLHTSEPDPSWDGESEDPAHDTTFLLASLHRFNSPRLEQFERDAIERTTTLLGRPQTTLRAFVPRWYEHRMVWRGVSPSTAVPILDELLPRCRQLGGVTSWQSLSV